MKYEFMRDHSDEFPVKKMAEVLNLSRSRYYAWLKNPYVKQRKDEDIGTLIELAFEKSGKRYGSPRIHNELKEDGVPCGKKRVARIMRLKSLRARTKKKFKITTDSKHGHPVADNIVARNFIIEEPNRIWVSDITYLWTQEGWLYLSVIIDLFSRLIVGYSMSEHIDTALVAEAFTMAVNKRKPSRGLIFHSDRGVQYASDEFRELLKNNEVIQSMSRKGNCWDNACAESFFSTLKIEEVYRRSYRTRQEARLSVFEYIEIFYNRFRKHSFLDYMSPVKYESVKSLKIA